MHELKKSVYRALESNDLDAIASLAKKNKGVLSLLVRLAYEKETLVAWRAIKAVGLIAREFVKADYEFLRETVRKLLWSVSDESGGIGWAAPELLGELVSADPRRFSDVIPIIASLYELEEDAFRPGVVYALMRIADEAPELALPYRDIIMKALSDPDPLARVYALQAVEGLKNHWSRDNRKNLKSIIEGMLSDRAEAWIYEGGGFTGVEVGEKAREVNHLMQDPKNGSRPSRPGGNNSG